MKISLFVHASKEHASDQGEKAGLEGEALQRFRFAGCEHEITYEVDPSTGEATAHAIDGRLIGGRK